MLIVAIALILICGLNNWNPVGWIVAGVMFVLYLFESAMSYDEFQNTHGKVIKLCDETPTVMEDDKFIKKDGKSGIVQEVASENDAFNRWVSGDFQEIERLYAKNWRAQLSNVDLNSTANELRKLGINTKSCKTHADAKIIAENINTQIRELRSFNNRITDIYNLGQEIVKRFEDEHLG